MLGSSARLANRHGIGRFQSFPTVRDETCHPHPLAEVTPDDGARLKVSEPPHHCRQSIGGLSPWEEHSVVGHPRSGRGSGMQAGKRAGEPRLSDGRPIPARRSLC